LLPFGFPPYAAVFVGWVGLRGAVSIFLAAIPTLAGLPDAALYFNVAFAVVLVSLVVQGRTVAPAARRLGLASRRTNPGPILRIERDIPGQAALEIAGYPLRNRSPLLDAGWQAPSWVRLLLVVRDGEVLEPGVAGNLRQGDYAYFLIPPDGQRTAIARWRLPQKGDG
jgi:cell volume regulation protein A